MHRVQAFRHVLGARGVREGVGFVFRFVPGSSCSCRMLLGVLTSGLCFVLILFGIVV